MEPRARQRIRVEDVRIPDAGEGPLAGGTLDQILVEERIESYRRRHATDLTRIGGPRDHAE